MSNQKAEILREVARLAIRSPAKASVYLDHHYPNIEGNPVRESISPPKAMRVFLRDDFIDRYSGDRLVNPGALRALSELVPNFQYHQHGHRGQSHIAYWELRATVDHLLPIGLGGSADESNYRTTSMLRNLAKRNATLEQLGWKEHRKGKLEDWDGLSSWLIATVEERPQLGDIPLIRVWHAATRASMRPRKG